MYDAAVLDVLRHVCRVGGASNGAGEWFPRANRDSIALSSRAVKNVPDSAGDCTLLLLPLVIETGEINRKRLPDCPRALKHRIRHLTVSD